jgi:hypothetical protein
MVSIDARCKHVQYTFEVLNTATDEQIKEEIGKRLGRGVEVRISRPLGDRNEVEWRETDGNTVEIELRGGGRTRYMRTKRGISREALCQREWQVKAGRT